MLNFARIIINLHHQKVDQVYTYRLEGEALYGAAVGMMIRVPFGNRQSAEGYIVELMDQETAQADLPESVPLSRIRPAKELLSDKPVFTEKDLALAREMQRRYMAPLSACLSLFVPKVAYLKEREVDRITLLQTAGEINSHLGSSQRKVLESLERRGGSALVKELREEFSVSAETLRSLVKKAYIRIDKESEGKPPTAFVSERTYPLDLNPQQQRAKDAIVRALEEERYEGFLLHGITGSGKTEVYMQCIQKALDRGKQAILLVPEISLTPQLIDVFTRRFGDKVGVTHSRMTDKERSVFWHLADRGEYRVVIGPRSALFTPFRELGLVILDEEHESSYRSEQMAPHYHAREVALERCKQMHCPLVLGSATPSVETYYRALSHEAQPDESMQEEDALTLLSLTERAVEGAKLPKAEIVDMREEIAAGNMSIFCEELAAKIRDRLEKKEQVILFLNRKGYSTTVSCRGCGFVLKCPRCNLPYTYHKDKHRLICHHCGKDVSMPETCPVCGSKYLKQFGIGTQKVEEMTKALFPEAKVMRMDMSTMQQGEDYEKVYQTFRKGEGDILIGTQMVAKGFDFPGVTLVGILAADMTLFDADFHGVEKTFQLLTQVAGRAGRAEKEGEVYIQTYSPEHYCIRSARDQDYGTFYKNEIAARRLLECPPFTHLAQVVISGNNEDVVKDEISSLCELMNGYTKDRPIEVLGPSPASLRKINNVFRWKILVKCKEEERLRNFILYCCRKWAGMNKAHELLTMDIDPASIL